MMMRLVLVIAILLGCSSVRADDVDDQLRQTVEAMNRNVPRALDSQVRLDRVGYAPRELQFYCSLVNIDGADMPPEKKSGFEREMRKTQAARNCSTPQGRTLIDAGVTTRYLFYGRDSHMVSQITISSSDCTSADGSAAQRPKKTQPAAPGTVTTTKATPTSLEAKNVVVKESQDQEATESSKTNGAAGSSPAPVGKQWTVKAGASYGEVMATLQGFKAVEKQPYGDYLDVTYRDPRLLTYPDAGGSCVLSFSKGKLSTCKGCDPDHFVCALSP